MSTAAVRSCVPGSHLLEPVVCPVTTDCIAATTIYVSKAVEHAGEVCTSRLCSFRAVRLQCIFEPPPYT